MKRLWLSVSLGALSAGAMLFPQIAGAALGKCVVLENNVAYLRIAATDKAVLDAIPPTLSQMESTNAIAGIVVDLRFAAGSDVDDLASIEHLLQQSKLPLAILINSQTAGASAKLAEDLREQNTGLVFGSAMENFQPDISIPASANDEKKFLSNPYAVPSPGVTTPESNTNLLVLVDIDHTTEADLVREKIKDGDQDDTTAQPVPQKPFIRDPVLAHGVDFLTGVAALRLSSNQP